MTALDAYQPGPTEGHDARRPAGDARPRVLIAIRHPMMRALTSELLERERGCWVAAEVGDDQLLADAIDRDHPELVVVDTGEFPACCRAPLRRFPAMRVIVIGPEPDGWYQAAALAGGAAAWIPRDRVGDDLAAAVRRVLGCPHPPHCRSVAYAGPAHRSSCASVVDRSPTPRLARMAVAASPATLVLTPRLQEGKCPV